MPQIDEPGLFRNYAKISPETTGETLADLDRTAIIDLYKQHGALLFRGFPLDTGIFRELTGAWCTHAVINDSRGRKVVDAENAIQTVNTGEAAFPLHPELAREPWKPDICFFACLQPPQKGGETTICDGTAIVRKLPRAALAALDGRRLRYSKPATPEELEYWLGSADPDAETLRHPPADCPFEFFDVDGSIVRSFTRPALHRTMFSDTPCFGNFLLFARYQNKLRHFPVFEDGSEIPDALVARIKRASDRVTVPVKWRAGDLLMLDNTRFMHGRRPIRNVEERSIITYFGFLDFAMPSPDEGPSPRWRDPAVWRSVRANI